MCSNLAYLHNESILSELLTISSSLVHFAALGNIWTASAHIITAVIGSGVLSLAWSMAQLGWIAGPLSMFFFASITILSAFMVCNCYRSPDPKNGPARNHSYLKAVRMILGKRSALLCSILLRLFLFEGGIVATITSGISARAIQRANCYHEEGHNAACKFGNNSYMLLFGIIQIIMSQIPDFHGMEWLSIFSAIMSFTYSIIGSALGLAKVIGDGYIKGDIVGVQTSTATQKVLLVAQALGDIAFAYPFSIILVEIQVFSQPQFAMVERWPAEKFPSSGFVNDNYIVELPLLPAFRLNLFRLCFRTAYVASTTGVAIIFPYFNQVLGVAGTLNFWPLIVYFPVEMYIVQKNIGKWITLHIYSSICLLVATFALVGSIEGLITAKYS